ncbi:MAG TPA: menaquinone biosynthesis protein [Gemmataceae bacterium]|nr:menaquinone biosynthesis protein [Gemmataceae bacterium]
MHTIRIGAVSYLNARPLVHGLAEFAPAAELILDLPSRLADRLAAGDLDVGLIPIVEYFRGDRYRLVPDIGITSHGPVLSVTLFSRVPWTQIRRVALDVGSRTSAALTQVILRQRYGVHPEIMPLAMDQSPEQLDIDAVLLIGDRAMQACLPGFDHAFDLGQEWHDWIGLPFTYAAWAVRDGVDLGPVLEALHAAKRHGQASAGRIAAAEAQGLGLDAGLCRRYLTNIIRYDLGPRERSGLTRFYELTRDLGLAPPNVAIDYYEAAEPVIR